MARVKVSRDVTVRATDTGNVHYAAGFEGRVPKAHAERIEAVKAGEWLDKAEARDGEDEDRGGDA
ncbi:hypothetical protein [Methylobacterium sp. JK268]